MATVATGATSVVAHARYGASPDLTAAHVPAGTYTPIPFTSATLDVTKALLEDNSITSNRQRPAARLGNNSVSGSIATNVRADSYDWLFENLMLNDHADATVSPTWPLKVGTHPIYDAIQIGYTNIGQYRTFAGCAVNQLQLTVPNNAVVSAQWDVMGTDSTTFAGAATGTIAAVGTMPEAFTHLGGVFKEHGTDIGYFTQITLTVTNGYTQSFVLGSRAAFDVPPGDLSVTGTCTAWFPNATLANRFLNEEMTDIEFTIGDTLGNALTFTLPQVRYTGAQAPIQNSGSVTMNLPFSASYDGTSATTLTITKTTPGP